MLVQQALVFEQVLAQLQQQRPEVEHFAREVEHVVALSADHAFGLRVVEVLVDLEDVLVEVLGVQRDLFGVVGEGSEDELGVRADDVAAFGLVVDDVAAGVVPVAAEDEVPVHPRLPEEEPVVGLLVLEVEPDVELRDLLHALGDRVGVFGAADAAEDFDLALELALLRR